MDVNVCQLENGQSSATDGWELGVTALIILSVKAGWRNGEVEGLARGTGKGERDTLIAGAL